MSLTHWRKSRGCRIASAILLFLFSTSQTLYGQEFHIQEGTHLYTAIREVEGGPLPSEEWELKMFSKVFVAQTPQLVASTPQSVALTLQNAIFFEILLEEGCRRAVW